VHICRLRCTIVCNFIESYCKGNTQKTRDYKGLGSKSEPQVKHVMRQLKLQKKILEYLKLFISFCLLCYNNFFNSVEKLHLLWQPGSAGSDQLCLFPKLPSGPMFRCPRSYRASPPQASDFFVATPHPRCMVIYRSSILTLSQ